MRKPTFASNRVQEIDTSKSSSDNGIDGTTSTLDLNLGVTSNVGEDIAFAQLNQGKLAVVAVGKEVCNFWLVSETIHSSTCSEIKRRCCD